MLRVVTTARPGALVAAIVVALTVRVAYPQQGRFTIPNTLPGTVASAVGECSMGEVHAIIELTAAGFSELWLTVPGEPSRQLRFEVDAVRAGRIVGRFDDGEICLLRIVVRSPNPGITDPIPLTDQPPV